MNFFFNAAYNTANYIGDTYSLSVNVNFSNGQLAGTEALLSQHQMKQANDDELATPVVVAGNTVYSHLDEQGMGYSLNEIHTLSSTVSSLAGTYNYTAQKGFLSAYASDNHIKGQGDSTAYGGSLETELAVNRNNILLNGINRGNSAGIIVAVDSNNIEDKSSQFALLDGNNCKIAVLSANQKVFTSLPAYTDQNYQLVNFSKSDYFITEPTRHITLYPGNIGYYSWPIEKRIIVIGRVTYQNRPLTNTWIHDGQNGIFSDEEGNFQLELPARTTTLMADNHCRIRLPMLTVHQSYLYIGDVSCS